MRTPDHRSDEEVNTHAPRKRALKFGKIQTADTTVLCKITWLNEFIYTYTGQPKEYEQMSITLFMKGFLIVMAIEKQSIRPFMLQHLWDLMEDMELY